MPVSVFAAEFATYKLLPVGSNATAFGLAPQGKGELAAEVSVPLAEEIENADTVPSNELAT